MRLSYSFSRRCRRGVRPEVMSNIAIAYFTTSLVIGLAQMADAAWLWRSQGRTRPLVVAFSLIEWAWAAASFLLWRQRVPDVPFWLPASFVIYVLAFGVAGSLAMVHERDPEKVAIPRSLILAGGVFGAVFFLASLSAIVRRI